MGPWLANRSYVLREQLKGTSAVLLFLVIKLLRANHVTSRSVTTGEFCSGGPKWNDSRRHVGVHSTTTIAI